jgi:hypothetical protein
VLIDGEPINMVRHLSEDAAALRVLMEHCPRVEVVDHIFDISNE